MQVAIISDVHNNKTNLKKVLDYCAQKEIEIAICCGDLMSGETLEYLSENFSGTLHFTFGNADWEWETKYERTGKYGNVFIYKKFGETEIDGKKVAFIHYPEAAKELCRSGKYDVVFYGHTHKPWEENIDKCKMLCPGNVAGEIFLPTFAVWDTKGSEFKLIKIHDLK